MYSNSCNWIIDFYPPTPIIELEQLVFVLPHNDGRIVVDSES
jgi:hypothetical protein